MNSVHKPNGKYMLTMKNYTNDCILVSNSGKGYFSVPNSHLLLRAISP